MRPRALDMRELGDRGLLEPRKFRKWNEQFLGIQHQPEAMSGDVGHFNFRNACAMQSGCHVRVSGSGFRQIVTVGHSSHNSAPVQWPAQARIWPRHQRGKRGHAAAFPPWKRKRNEIRLRERWLDSIPILLTVLAGFTNIYLTTYKSRHTAPLPQPPPPASPETVPSAHRPCGSPGSCW